MININRLFEGTLGNLPAYELGKLARNPNHIIHNPAVIELLQNLVLIDRDGRLYNTVKNVAVSAIEFDDDQMPKMVNPVIAILGEDSEN